MPATIESNKKKVETTKKHVYLGKAKLLWPEIVITHLVFEFNIYAYSFTLQYNK